MIAAVAYFSSATNRYENKKFTFSSMHSCSKSQAYFASEKDGDFFFYPETVAFHQKANCCKDLLFDKSGKCFSSINDKEGLVLLVILKKKNSRTLLEKNNTPAGSTVYLRPDAHRTQYKPWHYHDRTCASVN